MDIWSPEKRSKVMGLVRSQNTKPEIKLRKALFSIGYRYRIHEKKLPGKPDIVLPKYRTAIFVHGCFWHGHVDCRAAKPPKSNLQYWTPKLARNAERDTAHQENLKASGWQVIVIWECELRKDAPAVLSLINEKLKGDHS
jgi:DNA mismatch endonuclease (patch repair protein)